MIFTDYWRPFDENVFSKLTADDFSSAAISNIHVDATELITDDYDGVVILRFVTATHYQLTFVC